MTWSARRLGVAMLAVYAIAGALIVLWPQRVDAPYDAGLRGMFLRLHTDGVPAFVNYTFLESGANVVMFVPLGLLITLILSPRLAWLPSVIGFAVSGVGELAQLLFLPNRVASMGDVVANTCGAVIGTLVALIVRELVRRVSRDSSAGNRNAVTAA